MSKKDDHLCGYYGKADNASSGAAQKLASVGCKSKLCAVTTTKGKTVTNGGCEDQEAKNLGFHSDKGRTYACYKQADSYDCVCKVCMAER